MKDEIKGIEIPPGHRNPACIGPAGATGVVNLTVRLTSICRNAPAVPTYQQMVKSEGELPIWFGEQLDIAKITFQPVPAANRNG